MKKYLIIILLLYITTVYSQEVKVRPFCDLQYDCQIVTNDFIVLDINYENQLVAFKHVFEKPDTRGNFSGDTIYKTTNCNYAGMSEYPYSGIILGVYDIANQEYKKTFTIYESVYNQKDCTEYETSAAKLDSAKQYFFENNLDINKLPKPIELDVKETKSRIITDYEIIGNTMSFTFNEINFEYYNSWSLNSEISTSKLAIVSNTDSTKKNIIHTIKQQDIYAMGSSGSFSYTYAYQENKKFTFMTIFYHTSALAGLNNSEIIYFTPIFDLKEFK